jgi:protein-L-isoaspartate(D-aspartate) O-methyltransferase
MVDFAVQRTNMVDSQVRPSDVTDRRIPRAMLDVAREAFVPAAQRPLAYMDDPIKLANGAAGARWMPAPRMLAKMLQYLEAGPEDSVLDVGCTTGYATAILGRITKEVVGLETDAALAAEARRNLAAAGITNARIEVGPLTAGWPSRAPYDAILVEGTIAEMPPTILDQLKDGGRLVAIMIDRDVGRAVVWRRAAMHFDSRTVFDASAAMLPGFEKPVGFVF